MFKQTTQKAISLLLVVTLTLSLVFATPMTASAADTPQYTKLEKVTFAVPETTLEITFTNVASVYKDISNIVDWGKEYPGSGDNTVYRSRYIKFYLYKDSTVTFNKACRIASGSGTGLTVEENTLLAKAGAATGASWFEDGFDTWSLKFNETQASETIRTKYAGEFSGYDIEFGTIEEIFKVEITSENELGNFVSEFVPIESLDTAYFDHVSEIAPYKSFLNTVVATEVVAQPTTAQVLVNGFQVQLEAYNMDGSNYFKLRDVAYAIKKNSIVNQSTGYYKSCFDVGYEAGGIYIRKGHPYTEAGGELSPSDRKSKTAYPSSDKFYDSLAKPLNLNAYKINGSNYIKLVDIADIAKFNVEWDSQTSTISIFTKEKYDENGIEYLTLDNYLDLSELKFTHSSELFKKTAYWTAKITKDTYNDSKTNSTLTSLGFNDVRTFEKLENLYNMRVDVGVRDILSDGFTVKRVVAISFKGTENLEDWYRNIQFDPIYPIKQMPKIALHNGFYESFYNAFVADISKQINNHYNIDIFNSKDTLFFISGHSLGGGYAEILSLYMTTAGTVPKGNLITFGHASPPVGSKEAQEYSVKIGLAPRIQKIMCTGDIVPTAGWGAYTLSASPYEFNMIEIMGKSIRNQTPKWFHFLENTYIPYFKNELSK